MVGIKKHNGKPVNIWAGFHRGFPTWRDTSNGVYDEYVLSETVSKCRIVGFEDSNNRRYVTLEVNPDTPLEIGAFMSVILPQTSGGE